MKLGTSELVQYVYAACFLFVHALCDYEYTCTPNDYDRPRHPRGSCGNSLSELVQMTCMLYDDAMTKRSDSKILGTDSTGLGMFGTDLLSLPKNEDRLKRTSLAHQSAASFLRGRRSDYYSQNIVCECCVHDCNMYELSQYCP